MSENTTVETDQTTNGATSNSSQDEDSLAVVMAPDLPHIAVTPSEVEAFNSESAGAMREFDDSQVPIMPFNSFPIELRSSRGKSNLLVKYEDLHVVPGLNFRLPTAEWEEHIEWLTNEIATNGFREDCPLLVFPTKENGSGRLVYGIISGESRYHAVGRANKRGAAIDALPAVLAPEGLSLEEMACMLATSNTGKPFSALEQAYAAQRFSRWGRSKTEIATLLKVTRTYVSQLLVVAAAPHAIREKISSGQIAFQAVYSALKEDPSTAAKRIEEGISAAKRAGRDRVTPKFMQDQTIKAARAFAPKMQTVLQSLIKNEGIFALLDQDIQNEIAAVLKEIDEQAKRDPAEEAKKKAELKAERKAEAERKKAKKKADAEAKNAEAKGSKTVSAKKPPAAKKAATNKTSATSGKPAGKTTTRATAKTSGEKPATAAAARQTKSTSRTPIDGDYQDDIQQHPDD